jgi:hypothetical protein
MAFKPRRGTLDRFGNVRATPVPFDPGRPLLTHPRPNAGHVGGGYSGKVRVWQKMNNLRESTRLKKIKDCIHCSVIPAKAGTQTFRLLEFQTRRKK